MRKPGWTEEDVYIVAERAWSLYLQGRYQEAAVIFEGLVAADPENRYCRDALAAAWLAAGDPEKALEQLTVLLRLRSDDLGARTRRVDAYLQVGNYAAALADFEVLKDLLPRSEIRRLRFRLEAAAAQPQLNSGPSKDRPSGSGAGS
jgi:tetratricopeptide (TPR) repeat protein